MTEKTPVRYKDIKDVARSLTECYRARKGRGDEGIFDQLIEQGWKDLGSKIIGNVRNEKERRAYWFISLEDPTGQRYNLKYDYPKCNDPRDYDPEFEILEEGK